MGTYNIYGNVQIKVGTLDMKEYKIGDKVDIPDGIYVGYGGVIVVKEGVFIMEVNTLTDKWGQPITCEKVLRGRGLSELLDKTEFTTEKKPSVEIEPKKEVVEAPKVEVTPAPEKVEEIVEKKEEVIEKKEEKVVEPKVEEKKEEVIPEAPKEDDKK